MLLEQLRCLTSSEYNVTDFLEKGSDIPTGVGTFTAAWEKFWPNVISAATVD